MRKPMPLLRLVLSLDENLSALALAANQAALVLVSTQAHSGFQTRSKYKLELVTVSYYSMRAYCLATEYSTARIAVFAIHDVTLANLCDGGW
ncbi:hypothetical protein [Ktedonospora formicarum]|uniref:Secreted protein n=1 Tax=Ktedonospora formicarum TaxID=2778364 RepID=A0A8J3MNM9_9CHLR|nr:hypothetical protein [Ktedonospora formicarum]GHO42942.1 hypothetical protein KSX_11050 [Ktedonospora formicarum]